jgi:transmembrane sensor
MKTSPGTPDDATLREIAARWTVRRDRGLSAAESIEFELWLAADPRHADAMKRSTGSWELLDRVPEFVARRHLAEAGRSRARKRSWILFGSLAAAAAIVLAFVSLRDGQLPAAPAPSTLVAAGPRAVTLADGTLVRMNEGSEIVERFTAAERNVTLTRGEAHFTVTKNPARPFIVTAGAVRVRAVGTAFDVNLQSQQIDVLVTEGKVGVERIAAGPSPEVANEPPLGVAAGELAVVPVASASSPVPAIAVTHVDPAGVSRALAWHDSLLRLGGATLAEIAAEFERRTGQRVSIPDATLAQLRVGGRFRADDVDGFANLLATTFDIEVERAADGTLVLRKKNRNSR